MERIEYEMLMQALVQMGVYYCDGVECYECPLALNGRCMVVAMLTQLIKFKEAGNVKD